MQIKTTMRYRLTPVRMPMVSKLTNDKYWLKRGRKGTLLVGKSDFLFLTDAWKPAEDWQEVNWTETKWGCLQIIKKNPTSYLGENSVIKEVRTQEDVPTTVTFLTLSSLVHNRKMC